MSMECPRCQAPLETPSQRFCGQCGQLIEVPGGAQSGQAAAVASQATAVAGQAVEAAGKVAAMARRAATQLEGALMDPAVVGSVPGRSWSLVGAAAVAALVLTGLLLGRFISLFQSIGLPWSIVMLLGAAALAAQEMRNAGMTLPGFSQLPPAVKTWVLHPLIPPVFTGLTALHAFQLARLSPVPLAWVLVAALLIFDQSKKSFQAPEGVSRYLDFRLALRGYRPYLLIGAVLCFVALWLIWNKTSGSFSGGYESHFSSYYGGYVREYNALQNYWPGWEFTGRNLPWATLAELAIVGLVLASLYRGWRALPVQVKYVPLGVCALLFIWCWTNADRHLGPFLFLGGLLLMAGAWFMLSKGQDEGEYDLAHMVEKVKRTS